MPNRLQVLLVEDDPTLLDELRSCVFELGCIPHVARSAEEALTLLEKEENRVDLAISDLQMPGMDGFGLLQELKRRLPGVPVVLTSGDLELEETEVLARGARAFLPKPYSKAMLGNILERFGRTPAMNGLPWRPFSRFPDAPEECSREFIAALHHFEVFLTQTMEGKWTLSCHELHLSNKELKGETLPLAQAEATLLIQDTLSDKIMHYEELKAEIARNEDH